MSGQPLPNNHAAGSSDPFSPEGFETARGDLILSTLAINLLSLALPIMTLQVYDRILPSPGSGTLPVLIAGVCLAIFLETAMRLARSYILGRTGASYEHRMSCSAINRVLQARLNGVGNTGVGEFLHRISAVNKLKEFYSGYALTVYIDLIFVVFYFALIVYIAGNLAVVPAAVLTGFFILSLFQGQRLRKSLYAREGADDDRYNALIEMLEGIHNIKAFALEKQFSRRYEALQNQSCHKNFDVTQATANTFNAGSVFANLMIVAVISFGAITVLNGQLTSGGLIAVLLLSGRMMQPVQKGLGLWTRYQDFLLARVQLQGVFSIPSRARNSKTVELAHKDGAIELSGVSFGFDGQALFQDVDLSVAGGECILIAGGHGCGKTSLMKLMSGIYQADAGQVTLNGQDLKHYPDFLRADHVGFVSTDPAIFRGTIRDNITAFGRIAEPDAREVANLFRVDRDVARLPSGFDTVLTGTETDSIPPGLKQRIAIVRALAARPRFIAFDNADKALDKQAYDQVFSVLAQLKGRATLILSSTDKNIQALADRTFFIQSGSVHEVLNTHKDENIFPYQELRL